MGSSAINAYIQSRLSTHPIKPHGVNQQELNFKVAWAAPSLDASVPSSTRSSVAHLQLANRTTELTNQTFRKGEIPRMR